MSMRIKIGLDVDDVLYSCVGYACEIVNKKYPFDEPIVIDEVTSWGKTGKRTDLLIDCYQEEEFYRTQPILPGAQEFVKKLQEFADVYFVTAIVPECMGIRVKRLMEDFPTVPKENIIMGFNKSLIKLDVLLDDNPNNISSSICDYPIVFRRPWNQYLTGVLSVSDYSGFLNLIQKILNPNLKKHNIGNLFFVFIGPSASGKTEIMNHLSFQKIQSYTTRPKRSPGENDYHHISKDEFLQKVSDGFFFEFSSYAENLYGTSKEDVLKAIQNGHAMKAMDISGALKAKEVFGKNCVIIYVKRSEDKLLRAIIERDVPIEDKVNRIRSIPQEQRNEQFADLVLDNNGKIEDSLLHLSVLGISDI